MGAIAIESKIARFKAFWARENHDRPLIGFTGSYYPKETLESLQVEQGPLRPQNVDIDAFAEHCEREYERWAEYTGDGLWSATPQHLQKRWSAGVRRRNPCAP